MKDRIIIINSILLLIILLTFAKTSVHAAIPTPSAAPSITSQDQINSLKDKIASQVASLHLVDKKALIGKITDISETQLSITTSNGDTQVVDVDELTQFSSPSAKSSFGISDITKGTLVGITGLYNKDSRRLLARWVDVINLPVVLTGGILSIDKDNFTITIATLDNPSQIVEIEDITKTTAYTQTGGAIKSGFSKLQVGHRVLVVGFPDNTSVGMMLASRILVFPDLPVNPKIPMINPTDIAPVSTGSGKKLTPITK